MKNKGIFTKRMKTEILKEFQSGDLNTHSSLEENKYDMGHR